jgi:predicted metal-dependent hydrolase
MGRGGKAAEQGVVEYAGRSIEFAIRRSARRRTIGLTVLPDSSLVAAAPPWASYAAIAGFVREKAAWALQHQLRLRSLHGAGSAAQREFAEGDSLPLLGLPLTLRYADPAQGIPPQVQRIGGELQLRGLPAAHPDEEQRRGAVRRALEEWYRREALVFFTARTAHYCAQLGLATPRVSIGAAERRWGSCSSRGSLRYNWRLLLGPEELADYVAAHEAAHLVELNHSLRFWRVVAQLLPDFRARERRLAEIGATLEL